MKTTKKIITTGTSLSILAILGCFGIGSYVYFNPPEVIDISGIYDNRVDINNLLSDTNELQVDFDNLDLTIT